MPIPEYSIYGLVVGVDAPVPGLRLAAPGTAPDVVVHMEARPDWHERLRTADGAIYRSLSDDGVSPNVVVDWLGERDGLRLQYADGTVFYLSPDSREIWVIWEPPFTLEDAAVYLFGPVLSYVLRRRGVLCLHASAVVVNGRCAVFCGAPGAGKSTLAAAMSARGHQLLTDDVLAVAERDDRMLAWPGYDHLRLWNDSAKLVAGDEHRLPPLTPNWTKRAFPAETMGAGLAKDAVPIGWVFLLAAHSGAADAPHVVPLSGVATLVDLATLTSANYLLNPAMRAVEFGQLTRLLSHVKVFRLTPHPDAARLDDLLAAVLGVTGG